LEYAYYLAGILLAVAYCIYKVWELRKAGREERFARELANNESDSAGDRESQKEGLLQRDLPAVLVPWGWPGNTVYRSREHHHQFIETGTDNDEPGTMQYFVNHLVREKQTIHDEEYRLHLEESIKALLEDRFHSPGQKANGSPTVKKGQLIKK